MDAAVHTWSPEADFGASVLPALCGFCPDTHLTRKILSQPAKPSLSTSLFFFFQLVLFDQPGMISVLEAGESSEMTPRGKGAGDHKDLNLMPRQMD